MKEQLKKCDNMLIAVQHPNIQMPGVDPELDFGGHKPELDFGES